MVSSLLTSTARRKTGSKRGRSAAQVDHGVDRVHAHRRQSAGRGLFAVGAPGLGLQKQRIGEGHGGFGMHDDAEPAGLHALAQLHHFRMEAAVIAEPERDPGLLHRRDRILRFLLGQRERLFAIDMLALLRGGDHLRGVQRMRRGQHHRVDLRIGEQGLVAFGE